MHPYNCSITFVQFIQLEMRYNIFLFFILNYAQGIARPRSLYFLYFLTNHLQACASRTENFIIVSTEQDFNAEQIIQIADLPSTHFSVA